MPYRRQQRKRPPLTALPEGNGTSPAKPALLASLRPRRTTSAQVAVGSPRRGAGASASGSGGSSSSSSNTATTTSTGSASSFAGNGRLSTSASRRSSSSKARSASATTTTMAPRYDDVPIAAPRAAGKRVLRSQVATFDDNNNQQRLSGATRVLFPPSTTVPRLTPAVAVAVAGPGHAPLLAEELAKVNRAKSAKWNFDFDNNVPLPGPWVWEPVAPPPATAPSSPSKLES